MKKSIIFPVNSYFILLIISVNLDVGQCMKNGNITDKGDFKYHVYLENKAFTSCSGVVIDEWHILTAAHCVYRNTPSQLLVYVGTTVLRRGVTEIYEVYKIHIHKDYQISRNSILDMKIKPWPYHRANDIAILTADTGGGLLCDGFLVGIILTHNHANRPTVHANIYHFLDFLNEIIREDHGLYCSISYMSWNEI